MAEDTHCIPENLGDLLEVIPALSVKVLDLYRNDRVVESFEFLQKIEKGLHQHSQSCSDSQLEKINQVSPFSFSISFSITFYIFLLLIISKKKKIVFDPTLLCEIMNIFSY